MGWRSGRRVDATLRALRRHRDLPDDAPWDDVTTRMVQWWNDDRTADSMRETVRAALERPDVPAAVRSDWVHWFEDAIPSPLTDAHWVAAALEGISEEAATILLVRSWVAGAGAVEGLARGRFDLEVLATDPHSRMVIGLLQRYGNRRDAPSSVPRLARVLARCSPEARETAEVLVTDAEHSSPQSHAAAARAAEDLHRISR